MNTLGIVQARMGSSRLPGKAMIEIGGKPSLEWVVDALKAANGIDVVMVATSDNKADDAIAQWAEKKGVAVFRGSESDVLSRYHGAATTVNADIIVRTTGDCTLIDPAVIGQVVALQRMTGCDYACNTEPATWADGQDVECFTMKALGLANREATRQTDRECVTRWMVRNQHLLPSKTLVCPLPGQHKERYVLDSPEDLQMIREIVKRLGDIDRPPSYLQILSILEAEPWIRKINSKYTRNERFYADLAAEQGVKRSYATSKMMLAEAEHAIPLGAQTFSKSKLMFPEGAAPLFVTHGDGGYVFDVDGNDYIDLVGGLLPNVLGYRDPDVDAAIRDQLSRGISMSLATGLEHDLADRLIKHIPSAEMVRFGKNGSDVTTAAVRLARHITGRDKVVVGGYHGWHDWSMGWSAYPSGIPRAVKLLTEKNPEHLLKGGVIGAAALKTLTDTYAAVIIEPEFWTGPDLIELKKVCEKHGIILIFDEIITGFRCGLGGLQAEYGVTPDLSTFGKAMANGMPISALVGAEKYMKRLPEISFSGTFFGETLSIAAAIATIDKLEKYEVPVMLHKIGSMLQANINEIVDRHGIREYIHVYGRPELNRIFFKNNGIQSLFIQEMAKRGILIIGSHNTCCAHTSHESRRVLNAWEEIAEIMSKAVHNSILNYLDGGLVQSGGVR